MYTFLTVRLRNQPTNHSQRVLLYTFLTVRLANQPQSEDVTVHFPHRLPDKPANQSREGITTFLIVCLTNQPTSHFTHSQRVLLYTFLIVCLTNQPQSEGITVHFPHRPPDKPANQSQSEGVTVHFPHRLPDKPANQSQVYTFLIACLTNQPTAVRGYCTLSSSPA